MGLLDNLAGYRNDLKEIKAEETKLKKEVRKADAKRKKEIHDRLSVLREQYNQVMQAIHELMG